VIISQNNATTAYLEGWSLREIFKNSTLENFTKQWQVISIFSHAD
jgi:hypothetical protein